MSDISEGIIFRYAISFGGALTVGLIAVAAYYQLYRVKNVKKIIPINWTEVGTVTDIFIYPLKSGRYVKINEGECRKEGLVLHQDNKYSLKDRGILVCTEDERKVRNAKHYPKLLLISIEALNENEIILKTDDERINPLIINTVKDNLELKNCILWGEEIQECYDCGKEAAEWISRYCLGQDFGLRLGLAAISKRNVRSDFVKKYADVYDKITDDDLGLFSDLSSYMILSKSSLDDLNKKLSINISSLNFRPNIVIEGPDAFVEDNWDWIKIGDDVIFRSVKPCTRCIMVDFDPDTGIPKADQMVSKKLKEYRQIKDENKRKVEGNSPVMGFYAGIRKSGYIKIGEKIYVGVK